MGFETEGTAIYDTMCFVKNEVGGLVARESQRRMAGCSGAGPESRRAGSSAQPGSARTFEPHPPQHPPTLPPQVHTVGVGVAIGQSCMLLSAGEKGKRFMLEHATAMLHQPRVPPTGQRQAIEIQIKWREVRGGRGRPGAGGSSAAERAACVDHLMVCRCLW